MAMLDEGFSIVYNGWVALELQPTPSYLKTPLLMEAFQNPVLVHATSASVSKSRTVPALESYYTPFDAESEVDVSNSNAIQLGSNSQDVEANMNIAPAHGKIRQGYGLFTFSGEVTFELTMGALGFIFNPEFYKRNSLFSLQFYDGKKTCTVYNCSWTGISINGQSGSMVNVSIGYQSNNGYMENLVISDTDLRAGQVYDDTDFFVPYWRTGRPGIEEFTLSFSRSVSPQFLNNDLVVPTYLRVGLSEVSLQATLPRYIVDLMDDELNLSEGQLQIMVGSKIVQINNKILNNASYNMSSMDDIGKKTYVWESIRDFPTEKIVSFMDLENHKMQW